jgi:hypothetical protein
MGVPALTHAHGSLLCQPAFRCGVLGWGLAGPGSGLSEEPTSGVRSVTPDCRVVPDCPPGPGRFASFVVGEHPAVDDVGQPSFEGADGFHRGLAGGFLGVEVDAAAFGGVAELDHGHDVQGSVDPPVGGPGPLSSLSSRGARRGRKPCESHTMTPLGSRNVGASRRAPRPSLARRRSCAKSLSSREE